jgi:hypothetical protein
MRHLRVIILFLESIKKKGPRCYWKFNWLLLQSADFILDPLFQIKIFSDDWLFYFLPLSRWLSNEDGLPAGSRTMCS